MRYLCIVLAGFALSGCEPGKGPPSGENFAYHGEVLDFPKGTVDSRLDDAAQGPWVSLFPQGREDVNNRYRLDVGRAHTGMRFAKQYWLGFGSYADDAERTDLGEGYELYCQPESRRTRFYNCAALLKNLPFAAIQFRDVPRSRDAALNYIREAEEYLEQAKRKS